MQCWFVYYYVIMAECDFSYDTLPSNVVSTNKINTWWKSYDNRVKMQCFTLTLSFLAINVIVYTYVS